MMPGFTDKPMKIPSASAWKLEGWKWCWYVDPESVRASPFGKMTPGAGPVGAGLPSVLPTSADFVLNKVKADKPSVSLRAGESEQVKFTNTAPGVMDLTVISSLEGIEAKLDRTRLNGGEAAVMTLAAGKDPKPGVINVRVEQTKEFIAIQIAVK